jgi:SAM-dependent methyltransferase
MSEDQNRWDEKYRERPFNPGQGPAPFLKQHLTLLPRGKALDLAAGEGRNAVFLAEHGFEVEAVDISRVALVRAKKLAGFRGVKIKTVWSDLKEYRIPPGHFDLIIDFDYLDRSLIPSIKRGLKRGGLVIFETYTTSQKSRGTGGPENPEYLLKPNELLRLFKGLRVLFYREGIFPQGRAGKAIASLIAEKTRGAVLRQ